RADRLGHPNAARLRNRHRPRPGGRAGRGPHRPARGAGLGRGRVPVLGGAAAAAPAPPRGRPAPGTPPPPSRPALMPAAGQRSRRPAPRPGARYVGFVGLAFLVLIGLATYNTIRTASGGLLGVSAAVRGRPLPEFAVPNIHGGPNADANIFQDDCASSANPCPAGERRPSACRIPRGIGAIRVCDLFDRPLVISFWFLKGASCLPTQDDVNAVARRFRGRVNFLSIDVRDDIGEGRRTGAAHHSELPVRWGR